MPRVYVRRPVADRFWEKVDRRGPEECWPWLASFGNAGYGQMVVDGKHWISSRLAWTLTHGPIPDGMKVLHRCDNPACVNPAHLWLGTMADNQRDMAEKGRAARGAGHPAARLTKADVLAIRAAVADGETQKAQAERYGLSRGYVSQLINGQRWSHLK